MSRVGGIVRVVRMHLIAWRGLLVTPLVVLGLTFLYAFLVSVTSRGGTYVSGGLVPMAIAVLITYVFSSSRTFSFAMTMGVTRRSFFVGTWVVALAQAGVFGAALWVFQRLERLTDGWFAEVVFFTLGAQVQALGPVAEFATYAVLFVVAAACGLSFGSVLRRWGSGGLIAAVLAGFVVLYALGSRVGGEAAQPAAWMQSLGTAMLFIGWPLVFVLLIGGAGWAVMRRAPA